MAIATPAPTLEPPPQEHQQIVRSAESEQRREIPASSLALLAGLAAGALVLRRVIAR